MKGRQAEFIIVGGGIMGASLAFHLARRKVGRVLLMERRFLGAGSTGKTGAIIRQHYTHKLTTRMAMQGLQFFQSFEDRVGGPRVFTQSGMILVVPRNDEKRLEAVLQMQQQEGVDVRKISSDDLREMNPDSQLCSDEIAVYEPEAGYVEAMQALASFAEAARRDGAEILQPVEVKGIKIRESHVTGIKTSEGDFSSKNVIIAAGPWAASVAQTAGFHLPVDPCRAQVALFRRPATESGNVSVYCDFANNIYFKPTWGEMMHVGSLGSEEADAKVDPDHCPEIPKESFLSYCHARMCNRLPFMGSSPFRGGYSAMYSITPDWHPLLGAVPGIEGLYCAAGFSGHGFKFSPVVGRLMSELVVDGQTTLDIAPLRLQRFDESQPITTPYGYGVMG